MTPDKLMVAIERTSCMSCTNSMMCNKICERHKVLNCRYKQCGGSWLHTRHISNVYKQENTSNSLKFYEDRRIIAFSASRNNSVWNQFYAEYR